MKILSVAPLALPEVKVVRYARFRDERGYFTETVRAEQLCAIDGFAGFEVAQINESFSTGGVARGLHLQWSPFQGKLVRVLNGHLIDLACDLRKGSPDFGKVVAHELTDDPGATSAEWVWVPPGFGHGVLFPLGPARIEYVCTARWNPDTEASIALRSTELDWSPCDTELASRAREFLERAALGPRDLDAPGLSAWARDPRSDNLAWSPGSSWNCANTRPSP